MTKDKQAGTGIKGWLSRYFILGLAADLRGMELRIVGIYALFGALWIVLSDLLLEHFIQDTGLLTRINITKGWLFVMITCIILQTLVHRALYQIDESRRALSDTNRRLEKSVERLTQSNSEMAEVEEARCLQTEKLLEGQKKIAEINRRRAALMELVDEGVWEIRGEDTFFSDKCLEILGYKREELLRISDVGELIHPDDVAQLRQERPCDTPFAELTCRFRHRNGDYISVRIHMKSWHDEAADTLVSMGTMKAV